jgi:hypothetical protein
MGRYEEARTGALGVSTLAQTREHRNIDVVLICPRKLILASYHAMLSDQDGAFTVRPFFSARTLLENIPNGVPDSELVLDYVQ